MRERLGLWQKNPRRGGASRQYSRALLIARPLVSPQAQSARTSGRGEFPPRLSTPVEGSFQSRNPLQINWFWPSQGGWLCWPSGCRRRVGGRVSDQIELSAENLW